MKVTTAICKLMIREDYIVKKEQWGHNEQNGDLVLWDRGGEPAA